MPAVLSIVGRSKVGKTTFLEKLVPEIKSRGYRVGTIKHDAHDHFEIDHKGKDTWRHREAGAQVVAISSPTRFALTKMVKSELNVDSIVATYFTDEDLVLTEGYKSGSKEKIEICRKELKSEPLCNQADRLVAVVSDFSVTVDVPLFELEDISGVADFIEERFLKKTAEANVVLRLDGKKVPMKSFVKDFVLGGILGMISNLRGYGDPSQVDISIRLKKDERLLKKSICPPQADILCCLISGFCVSLLTLSDEGEVAGMVGVVLVGGKSRRYGRNKALEFFQGERLIDRQVRTVGSLFSEVLVITNEPELYLHLDVTIVRDVIPGQGPLGGIYTGLIFAQGKSVFVTACDMPFVQPTVVRRMVQLAKNYDVIVPEKIEGLEPLHAIYSSLCLPHIEQMLDHGTLQVINFFPAMKVYRLSSEEIGQLDPQGLSFVNINTPDDMDRAKELLEGLEESRVD